MAAARFSSDALRMFYGPIPEEENRNLPRKAPAAEPTLSEAIQNLPPELREMILKEYLAIKMRKREAMGWYKVYYDLLYAPFCEERERIVKVVVCRKCSTCGQDGLCFECFKNGVFHYICQDRLGVHNIDKIFQKVW